MEKGIFIAIEGGDGLGKTTLLNNLKKTFTNAVFTHEPGGCEFSEQIRKLLMDNGNLKKETEMFLFCTSRSEFVDKVVLPNINSGKMVVTDRYVYSSLVYQGILGELGIENVENVNKFATRGVVPDIVICLVGKKSFRETEENRFDIQTGMQAKAINDGFVQLSKKYNNFVLIDVADKNEIQVFETAKKAIDDCLKKCKKKNNTRCKNG